VVGGVLDGWLFCSGCEYVGCCFCVFYFVGGVGCWV